MAPRTETRIGRLTPVERQAKITRYRAKRARRIWKKKITYNCRKKVADQRLRVKGRFISKEEAKAYACQSAERPPPPLSAASPHDLPMPSSQPRFKSERGEEDLFVPPQPSSGLGAGAVAGSGVGPGAGSGMGIGAGAGGSPSGQPGDPVSPKKNAGSCRQVFSILRPGAAKTEP